MCTGGCGGSGGRNSFTPRTSTSRPYTPTQKTPSFNRNVTTGKPTANGSRASAFGTPKIKFGSR